MDQVVSIHTVVSDQGVYLDGPRVHNDQLQSEMSKVASFHGP